MNTSTRPSQVSSLPSSKSCSKCGETKELTEFPVNTKMKLGRDSWCYLCRNTAAKLSFEEQPEAWRDSWYLRKYGISLREYEELFESQSGICLICQRHADKFKRKLVVDHDHSTGEVRGLLCFGCNMKLGWVEKYLNPILTYLGMKHGKEEQVQAV